MNFYNNFLQAANNHRDKVAITGDNYSVTYTQFLKEVTDLANSLPDYLLNSAGAIVLPRKKSAVSWQLALNSKNLAFSNIDPLQPFTRLEQMLEQLRPSIIVCEKSNHQLVDWCREKGMTGLLTGNSIEDEIDDEIESLISGEAPSYLLDENRSKNLSTDEIAFVLTKNYRTYPELCRYIVFSSGSTGNPKAIMMNDTGAVCTIQSQIKEFGIKGEDNVLWALNPGFDASLSDIYCALFSGANLCIYPEALSKIKTVVEFLNFHEISVADLPPSILPYIDLDKIPSLKTIIFGGEVANEAIILKHSEKANMFNVYGPTETSICASFSKVVPGWTSSCIGQPLDGFVFSINPSNQELIISSNSGHIALGYLDLPELTKEKFSKIINDDLKETQPITEHNFKNFNTFNSADSATFDGANYFYLGRIDRQFKHLGNLVSPEEIEKIALNFEFISHAQAQYDEVKKVIILNACLKDTRNGTNLNGMDLITNMGYNEDMKLELKMHLKRSLPSFMQPGIINFVSMKTNHNGKVAL